MVTVCLLSKFAMAATGPEFLACGENILVSSSNSSARPSREASKQQQSSPRAHPDTLFLKSPASHHDMYSSHLGELSNTLVFSEDAIASLSPGYCSYITAQQDTKELFNHQNMGIALKATKRHVGRHSSRGPGFKHLPCHLTVQSPSFTIKDAPKGKVKNQHLASKVTKQPFNVEKMPSLKDKATHRPKVVVGGQTLPSVVAMDSFPDELSGNYSKGFVEHLQAGAKPLYVQGRESIIFLDNDMMFKKMLQPRYPQSPIEYQLTPSHRGHPVTPNRTCVQMQGHKRWMGLPRAIEAS